MATQQPFGRRQTPPGTKPMTPQDWFPAAPSDRPAGAGSGLPPRLPKPGTTAMRNTVRKRMRKSTMYA